MELKLSKYQRMSLSDLLDEEKLALRNVLSYEDYLNQLKDELKELENSGDDIGIEFRKKLIDKYTVKLQEKFNKLCSIRADIRQYFRHNGIIPGVFSY